MLYPFSYVFQQFTIPKDRIDVSSLVVEGGESVDLYGLLMERYSLPLNQHDPNAWCYLHWDILIEAGEIVGFAYYSTTLFEQSTIHRLIREYQQLLRVILDHPTVNISEIR